MKKILIALFVLFSTPVVSYAETMNADATVAKAITLQETTALSFGRIIIDTSVQSDITGTLDNNDTVTFSGAGNTRAVQSRNGVITVSGDSNAVVNMNVSNNVSLRLGSVSLTANLKADNTSITLNDNGTGTVRIGGQLSIPKDAPVGHYLGTYNVTAVYG